MKTTSITKEGFESLLYNKNVTSGKCLILNMIFAANSMFVKKTAEWLNTQNVAALALNIVNGKETPKDESEIPLEYITKATAWLKINGYSKIGILGHSLGAEMALAASSVCSDIVLTICLSPFDQVFEGVFGMGSDSPSGHSSFTYAGKELPYQPFRLDGPGYKKAMDEAKKAYGETYGRMLWDNSREAGVVEDAVIRTENISGKLLLFAAKPDTCWDSAGAAGRIADRRAEHGLKTELHVYEHGTHMIYPECVPMINLMTRFMMKECKKNMAEVKRTRADVSRKIEVALKEW